MPPGGTPAEYDEIFATAAGIDMIEKGHYSTMKPQEDPCAAAPDSANCEGFMQMHRRMGYNYQIDEAIFAEELSEADSFVVEISGHNVGVAPMYADWDVQIALLAGDVEVVALSTVDTELRQIAAAAGFSWMATVDLADVDAGTYSVALRIIQPGADHAKVESWGLEARNTYILLANELETQVGEWSEDHVLIGGWSILGAVQIQ
jgi:hypothetical protein